MEFQLSALIPAPPQTVYDAWLSSDGHSAMTGAPARITAKDGATFMAWDGYITGRNLELEPGTRIVQSWRTANFSESEPDSIIEIEFKPITGGTYLFLKHKHLPPHGTQYESGWVSHYFEPMQRYFTEEAGSAGLT